MNKQEVTEGTEGDRAGFKVMLSQEVIEGTEDGYEDFSNTS